MLDDVVPGGIAQSWRGDLFITPHAGSRPLSGEAPEHNRCRLGRTLAYNVYVARGSVDDMTCCTACPRGQDIQAVFVETPMLG
jgi:hypothetical protein